MSYYDALLAPARDIRREVEGHAAVGAWIATPGWLAEQVELLKGEYVVMGKEMHQSYLRDCVVDGKEVDSDKCERMGRFYDEVWAPMAARFYKFADEHTGGYWKLIRKNFWGNVYDNIKEHRKTLINLRDRAEAAGFKFQSAPPLPLEATPWDTISTFLKWIVGALVGFAAVYALTGLVSAFKG